MTRNAAGTGLKGPSRQREEYVEEHEQNTLLARWAKEIQKVARKAEKDWPGLVEADDIFQEVCIHILEAPGTQRDLAEMDDSRRYRTLHKIAQRLASKARDDYYLFSGSFRYSVAEVDELLKLGEYAFLAVGIESSWNVGDVVSMGGDHSDPTARAALDGIQKEYLRKDLRAALEKMQRSSRPYFDILVRKFVSQERGMDSTERSRLERALVELTNEMNHSHKQQHAGELVPYKSLGDGPGTRKAISNSTARYVSKEGYDSDYYPAPSHLRDNHIENEVWE